MSDDFYIGYQKEAPEGIARLVRLIVFGLVVIVLAVMITAGVLQRTADEGTFEFGVTREFEGILVDTPFPHFVFAADVEGTNFTAGDRAVLVAFGKYGMPEALEKLMNTELVVRGSLIYRDTIAMIEVASENAMDVLGDADRAVFDMTQPEPVTVTGELVDTKCYLGVMRPGEGKVHRACASVCLRGGIPPGLLVRGEGGDAVWFLVDEQTGMPLDIDPELAARRITVSGKVVMADNLPTLNVDSWELTEED